MQQREPERYDMRTGLRCFGVYAALLGTGLVVGGSACTGSIGGGGEPQQEVGTSTTALCDAGIPDAGRSGLLRVAAYEYQALLDAAFPGADAWVLPALPSDTKLETYDNNGATSVGELEIERYESLAESVATQLSPDLGALLPCEFEPDDETECLDELLDELGPRLFRRPLELEQREALHAVFSRGRAAGTFADGVLMVVRAVLQSPSLLYRIEEGDEVVPGNADVFALSGYALAERLALAIWQSGPDDALLAAAVAGELGDAEGVERQARRMLQDERAAVGTSRFVAQWLGYDHLLEATKDEATFPEYDDTLARQMRAEADELVAHVVLNGDGRLSTLLTTREARLTPALAHLYGLEDAVAEGAEWTELPAQRAGILTRAAVLTAHSHPEQTSPVLRGVFVRRSLLCQHPPPPPPDVDDTAPAVDPDLTTRERFAVHTESPGCAGCHQLIDPLGFGFESFDPIGRFREKDGGHEIDARGNLIATDVDGPYEGAVELSEALAASRQVHDCTAQQWFTFATGRSPAEYDLCSLNDVQERFSASGGDLRELMLAIVTSDAFRHYRQDGGE
ncbi:MAG: DUF1588 domain-containing protein [Myxococcota bacterium]